MDLLQSTLSAIAPAVALVAILTGALTTSAKVLAYRSHTDRPTWSLPERLSRQLEIYAATTGWLFAAVLAAALMLAD